jgi:hypothetical protein
MKVQFLPHSEHTASPLQIQTDDVKILIGRSEAPAQLPYS